MTRKSLILCVLAVLGLGLHTAWAQPHEFKIENPDSGHPTREMGRSVAVDGDTMIAGAPTSAFPIGLTNAGVARVYRTNGLGGWTLEAELTASDAAADDSWYQEAVCE